MSQINKLGNISAIVGVTKNGKKIYRTVGSLFKRDDGSYCVALDTSFNLAAISKKSDDPSAWCSVYPERQVNDTSDEFQPQQTTYDEIPF